MHDYDLNSDIIFYSQVATNGVSCWNTAKSFSAKNHVVLQQNPEKMIYPSDLNVSICELYFSECSMKFRIKKITFFICHY